MASKLQVTPTKLQATPTKLQVTPAKLQVTPTKLQVTLTKLQVTPTKLQVTRSKLTSLTAETNKFQLTNMLFITFYNVVFNARLTVACKWLYFSSYITTTKYIYTKITTKYEYT